MTDRLLVSCVLCRREISGTGNMKLHLQAHDGTHKLKGIARGSESDQTRERRRESTGVGVRKARETKANWPAGRREEINRRHKETAVNKSPEEKAEMERKRLETRANWSPEFREEVRKSQVVGVVTSILNGRHLKNRRVRVVTLKGGSCSFRSDWEVKFADILDEDPDVVRYEYETFRIPYTYEGKYHETIPDFYVLMVDGTSRVIEVAKDWEVESDSQRIAKMMATDQFTKTEGYSYLWWDSNSLREFKRTHEGVWA